MHSVRSHQLSHLPLKEHATINVQVKKDGYSDATGQIVIEVKNQSNAPNPNVSPAPNASPTPNASLIPNVLVSSNPVSVKPGESSTITFTVTGNDGKGIPGANVELKTNVGQVNPASGITDSSGKFTSTFSSSAEGNAKIEAQVNKEGLNNAAGETIIEVKNSDGINPFILALSALVAILSGFTITIKMIGKKKKKDSTQAWEEDRISTPETTPSIVPIETGLDIQIEQKSIPADGKSTATVTIKLEDENGNFVASSAGRTVELSTTLGKVTSPIKILPGEVTVTATITAGQDAGTAKIKASSRPLKGKGKQLNGTGEIVFTKLGSKETALDIQIEPAAIPADGKSTATVTIRIIDENGNFIPSPNGRIIELTTALGKVTSPIKMLSEETEATSTITAGQVAGTVDVKASSSPLKGEGKTLRGNGEIIFTGVTAEKGEAGLDIQIEPAAIPADGKSTATVTIRIIDENGNPIPSPNGRKVELSTALGKVSSPIKILPGEMEATSTIISGQAAGTAIIKASSSPLKGEGKTLRGNGEIIFTEDISDEAGLDIQVEPESIPADGKSTATVTIRIIDENGNFIPSPGGRIIELSTALGKVTSPIKILPGETEVNSTITAGQDAGTAKVKASSSPLKGEGKTLRGNGEIVFTNAYIDTGEAGLDIQIEPESIPADGKSTSTVTVKIIDENGNFIPSPNGRKVELSTTKGKVSSPAKTLPAGEMEVTATVTAGLDAGTAIITVSSTPLKGEGKTLRETREIVFTKVIPNEKELDIQIEPESISADRKSTATVTIKIKDENGKFIPSPNGKIVVLSTTLGKVSSPIKVLPGEMEVTSTITAGQDAGTAEITASSSPLKGEGKELRGNGEIVFTKVIPNEKELDIQIEPESIPADGKSTAIVTIRIIDENGKFISSPNGRIVELSTTKGEVSSPIKILPGESVVTATITSEQAAGTAKITASSSPLKGVGKTLRETREIVFTEVMPPEVGLDIQIEPASIPADGKSTAKVTIKIKDDKGNFILSQNEKMVELSTTLGKVTSHVKIPYKAQEGTATITSGRVVGTANVKATSYPNEGEGEPIYGEGKVVFM